MEGVDQLGVDDEGNLYWAGKRLEVARTITLNTFQQAIAVIGVLTAVAVALVEWLRFFGYGVR
ncbi:hypothetical protein J4G37_03600 [Microvirga sp. 3-52]|nr:hypothetical protein [Microvirga sp. 3-52]